MKFRKEVCGGEAAIQDYCMSIARRGGAIAAGVLGTDILDADNSCTRKCNFANVRLPLDVDSLQSPETVPIWLKMTSVKESGLYYQAYLYRGHFYWRLSGMIYVEEADFRKGAEVLKALCERVKSGEHVKKTRRPSDGESTSEETPPDTPVTETHASPNR